MLRLVLAALLLVCSLEHGLAQESRSQKSAPPSDLVGRLDAALNANDFDTMARLYLSAPVLERLNWARDRVLQGSSVAVAHLYAGDLWRTSQANKLNDLSVTAGSIALYIIRAMTIDGARCADVSAVSARWDKFGPAHRNILAFLKTQPDAIKAKAIEFSNDLEKATAQRRGNDHWLCRGGLAETIAGLKAAGLENATMGELQNKLPAAPPQEGVLGKSVVLPRAKDFVPEFRPREKYEPEIPALRERAEQTVALYLK